MRRLRHYAWRHGAACSGTEEERDRVADTLRLAEALGGEAITMPSGGRSIADDVVRFAQANNVTQIVIGKSARSRWFEILHGSVVHDLVRRSGNISVHVIAGDELARDPIPKKTLRAAEGAAPFDPWPYLVALAAVAAALGVGELIQPVLGIENVDLVFLTAVVGSSRALWALAVAARHRRLVAVLQFLLPAADLYVHHRRSHQPRRARVLHRGGGRGIAFRRARTQPDRGRARRACARWNCSTRSAASWPGSVRLDDVLWATAYQAALMLKVRVVLLLPEDGSIAVKAGYPPEDRSRRG